MERGESMPRDEDQSACDAGRIGTAIRIVDIGETPGLIVVFRQDCTYAAIGLLRELLKFKT